MSDEPVLAALARLEAGQAKLEAGQAKLEGGQAKLEGGQGNLEAGLLRLRVDVMQRLDGHGDRLTKIEAEQVQFRTDVMTRFEHVEDRLTAIREDIGVNMGRADIAANAADHNRQELGQLWRMIQRLQTRLDQLESKA